MGSPLGGILLFDGFSTCSAVNVMDLENNINYLDLEDFVKKE
jgi:hypothetical protein